MSGSTAAISTPAVAEHPAHRALLLGALGVVFGDIGTSPIYAFRESLRTAAAHGMPADQALAVLRFAPQAASEPVYKVLASAVANARQSAERQSRRVEADDLLVHEAFVDEGPTMKRFRPRAQGRAFRVRKRTSHITVVVAPRPGDAKTTAPSQKRRTR